MKFLRKDINKFKECLTNESTKNIHLWRKKGKHGAKGNTQMPVTVTEGLAPIDEG